jgi:hypothetical protein
MEGGSGKHEVGRRKKKKLKSKKMKRSSTYNNSITWNLELATPVKYSPGIEFHGVNLQLETCNLKPAT